MILDCHVHIWEHPTTGANQKELLKRMKAAGISGGVILSPSPASFTAEPKKVLTSRQRLQAVLEWTAGSPTLFPFYWIDPTEKDAIAQVKAAAAQGIAGFKIICSHHYPCDPRAMKTYAAIAQAQKPILFHSGILWDGQSSSKLNRPTEFEGLLEVKGLRFALAHVSWPWHDECIAMFGKIQDAIRSRKNLGIEMFFDLTPGTPMIYREEVLRKLFTIGYKVEDNILFGIDTSAEKYDTAYAKKWVTADMAIMKKLKVPASVQQKVFSGNVKRFIGA